MTPTQHEWLYLALETAHAKVKITPYSKTDFSFIALYWPDDDGDPKPYGWDGIETDKELLRRIKKYHRDILKSARRK